MLTRQLFWLGMGATVGVLGYRRAVRVAEAFTPENLAHSAHVALTELVWEARAFADDVRVGMELHASSPSAARPALTGPPLASLSLTPRGPNGHHL